jgi:integrase
MTPKNEAAALPQLEVGRVYAWDELLQAAETRDCCALVKTAMFTGMRLGELLGLLWEDVDFATATIHVHRQWSREGYHAAPKTAAAVRRVVLAPDLISFLRIHRARSRFSTAGDHVFASRAGTALAHRNVCRSFTAIVKQAGLDGEPKVTFHSLRHIYASTLIERGCSATVVAEQMGHVSSRITEERYIHLFNRVRTDEAVRSAIQQAMGIGNLLASTPGNHPDPEAWSRGAGSAPIHAVVPTGSR